MGEEELLQYVLVVPGEFAWICNHEESYIRHRITGGYYTEEVIENAEHMGEISIEDDVVVIYDLRAAEQDRPMNRVIPFTDGRRFLMSGTFAVVRKDKDGKYCSLTNEQAEKFEKIFKNPQKFIMAFGKMLVLDIRNATEINLIHQVDLGESLPEEGEPENE